MRCADKMARVGGVDSHQNDKTKDKALLVNRPKTSCNTVSSSAVVAEAVGSPTPNSTLKMALSTDGECFVYFVRKTL